MLLSKFSGYPFQALYPYKSLIGKGRVTLLTLDLRAAELPFQSQESSSWNNIGLGFWQVERN